MITLYARRDSSNCAKVFLLLDLLDLPFDLIPMGRGSGARDTVAFERLTPFGKVPVITDGALVAWESNAILRSLAKRTQRNTVWPEDQRQQTRIDGWMDWASLSLTPPLTRLRKVRAAGGEGELAAVIEAATLLDWQLGQSPFIAGDTLSLADIAAAPSVYRLGLLSAQEPHLPKLPHLLAYRETLETDPLYRLHIRDALT